MFIRTSPYFSSVKPQRIVAFCRFRGLVILEALKVFNFGFLEALKGGINAVLASVDFLVGLLLDSCNCVQICSPELVFDLLYGFKHFSLILLMQFTHSLHLLRKPTGLPRGGILHERNAPG